MERSSIKLSSTHFLDQIIVYFEIKHIAILAFIKAIYYNTRTKTTHQIQSQISKLAIVLRFAELSL